MKSIVIAWVLFAGAAWADEVADRSSIEKAVGQLIALPTPAGLFTDDFDGRAELTRVGKTSIPVQCPEVWPETCPAGIPVVVANEPGTIVISKEPMGEAVWFPASMAGKPIVISKIRFLTPEVAMVDALWSRPVLLVLKKVGTDWKIASLRILAEKTS